MDASVSTSIISVDLQQLVEQSLEQMAIFDGDRRYCAVSPALAAVLTINTEVWLGQTNAELASKAQASALPKPWQKYWRQIEDALLTVLHRGEAERRIHPVPTVEGVQLHESTYTPIRNQDGEIIQIISISRVTGAEGKSPKTTKSLTDAQLAAHPDSIVGAEMPQLEDATIANLTPLTSNPSADVQAAVARLRSVRKRLPNQMNAIHQSAEFLQIVLDNIPQYIFWKDRNSVYQGCNQRWAEMAGFSHPSEVVGITDAELPWTQEQLKWYLECDRRVMETDTPMLRIKQSQLQADGKLSWRETSKLPLHDEEGNVVGLLGTIEDVTERKVAEDLLKHSEKTYRKIAKQKELLNQLSTQIRQFLTVEAIQDATVHEVQQFLNADRVLIYRFDENWQGCVVTEATVSPWSSLLNERSIDNCFPEEHAELYLQGRTRIIPDIETADIDDCHRDFLANLQVRANAIVPIRVKEQLWGLLIAHQCSDARDWQADEIDLLMALADQVSIAIQQAELYTQAQKSATVAKEKARQLETTIQTLRQTQTQLIQTEKMSGLGQMVAGIAHEINNPVNFIHGNIPHIKEYLGDLIALLDLYRRHYPNPTSEIKSFCREIDLEYLLEDLGKILKSFQLGSQRIQQIVTSLRTFSRLDEAERKAVNLHEGIESTLLILHHRFKAKPDRPEIRIVKEYGDLPLVECYPSQLNQVFMNLLSNAVDALEQEVLAGNWADTAESPTVWIKTAKLDHQVLVCIRDNGPGVPEQERNRLFDPFFTTKPIGKGTGLGLSISHQIIAEKHGGRLMLSSEMNQGAEFQILIPYSKRSANREAA